MSSFHKVTETISTIAGSKLKNNLPIVSSGIPSLDHVIGGGLPCGSIFLVEEDMLANFSRTLCKYFLAEGVACKHGIFIASAEEDANDIIKELPTPCESPPSEEPAKPTQETEQMQIAWRYDNLKQVESSFGNNTNFGHHFDLSKYYNESELKQCNITFWNPSCGDEEQVNVFNNGLYLDLLTKIKEEVSKEEYQQNAKKKNILRINVLSIGSPIWLALDSEEDRKQCQDLLMFMFALRVVIRDTNSVAYVTVPSHLFKDDDLIQRLEYSVDNAIRLESFDTVELQTNPLYKDYHGLFHILKLSGVNSLVSYIPPSTDLAFKVRRKRFVIEKLHLPPELEESSEREQDDVRSVPMCGGFKKRDIEF